ncbi:MAG TPA: CHAP domain-containing protein [Lachnospiraceae bacterium]|nr:CHAP domain-containing protein [Lachnospiraceae bacterium]
MSKTADQVIRIAMDEVGYCEKSKRAWQTYGKECLYSKTAYAGSDNYTKYGYELSGILPEIIDFPAAWCDCFVDWCFYKAFGVTNAQKMLGGRFDDYTKASAKLYIGKEAFYYAAAGLQPKPGDQIFFAKSGSFETIYHTGLVYKVDSANVYTIEGNTSDGSEVVPNGGCVCRKSYALTNAKIYGYGRPKYEILDQTWRWVYSGGKWYYQDSTGKNSYGWKLIAETGGSIQHWYWFDEKGAAATGWKLIDGKWYYFEQTGPCACALYRSDETGAQSVWYL